MYAFAAIYLPTSVYTMKQTFFILLVLFFASCSGQHTDNNSYQVGKIPDLASFETFNKSEKRLDSILKPNEYERRMDSIHGDNTAEELNFKSNHARMFVESFSNGKSASQDTIPALCFCNVYKDTMFIKFAVGLFGGMGAEVKILPNHFESNYFIYTGGATPYKYNLSDKQFTNQVKLKNKTQSLILSDEPSFKAGQQITGYLTFTTPFWYEKRSGNNIDTNYVKAKVYFTCECK